MVLNNCSYNDFIYYLLNLIGATLVGVKPAEILTLPIYEKEEYNHWQRCKENFIFLPQINYIETRIINNRQQVFFYHQESLDIFLDNQEVLEFLQQIGYPEEFDRLKFLEVLTDRLKSEDFPHEIGVFLGYPLKDVKGYMGFSMERLMRIKGWHYYGDMEESYQRYLSFKDAQERVEGLLQKATNFTL